jgi:TetR/AcrR family transcriptional regulator, tetracycline repressor protein
VDDPIASGSVGDDAVPARASVTPAEIVGAALEIVDEQGFGALSMRGIATRLGVFPATLYWHVGNRAQLLGLLCETVLSRIELPDAELDWRDWVFTFGLRTRQVIGAHPRFAAYFVTNIQVSGASLEIADGVLGALGRAGFEGNDLLRAYNVIIGTIFGWISGEYAAGAEDTGAGDREQLETLIASSDERFENIRRTWPTAANRAFMLRWNSGTLVPLESSYELMLGTLLDGLEKYRR